MAHFSFAPLVDKRFSKGITKVFVDLLSGFLMLNAIKLKNLKFHILITTKIGLRIEKKPFLKSRKW